MNIFQFIILFAVLIMAGLVGHGQGTRAGYLKGYRQGFIDAEEGAEPEITIWRDTK